MRVGWMVRGLGPQMVRVVFGRFGPARVRSRFFYIYISQLLTSR